MTVPSRPSLAEVVAALGLREPTEEQAEIAVFPPFRVAEGQMQGQPLLVVAGAGSGKTETLSLRATYLCAHYAIPGHSILGLTFTRKAAGELADRLRARLQAWTRAVDSVGAVATAPEADPVGSYEHIPEATTYNAFALHIVQEFGAQAGFDPQAAHLGEAAAWQLMSEVVAGWGDDLGATVTEGSVVDRVLGLRESISNQALTLKQAHGQITSLLRRFETAKAEGTRSYTKTFHEAAEATLRQQLQMLAVIEEFDRRKDEMGAMDYADQVLAAIKIVEEDPEVRAELRRRHQVVFLDEFQDTSVAQMRLLSALFAGHPVTAVGDPNQAIYGWRGASAASLQDFHHRFVRAGDPHVTLNLSTAWRNDRGILAAANAIAAPLAVPPAYLESEAPSKSPVRLPELSARPGAGVGMCEALFTVKESEALEATVRFVADQRGRLSQDGGATPASVAVLSRTRGAIPTVVSALREAGIPAQAVGGDSLLAHPVIRDLRATLEITNDIGGSEHLLRLLTNLDLGAADLRALGNHAQYLGRRRSSEVVAKDGTSPTVREPALLIEAVDSCAQGEEIRGLSSVGTERVRRLGRRLARLRRTSGTGICDQIQEARAVMGLDIEASADPTSEDITSVLDVFADTGREYEMSAQRPTMAGFLTWLDAAELRERGLSAPQVSLDPNAVQVMTIHAAKGLEWDAVALVDVAAGRFPSGGRGSRVSRGEYLPPTVPSPSNGWIRDAGMLAYPIRVDHRYLPDPPIWDMTRSGTSLRTEFREDVGQHKLDEERRLAYVAVTRARHAFLMVGSWFANGKTPRFPSVFMAELFASCDPSSKWEQFCDGHEHRVAPVAEVSRSRTQPLTKGSIHGLPDQETWPQLSSVPGAVEFPRDPGSVRRRIEQGAARVYEELQSLLDEEVNADQVLASLADSALALDVRALLDERETAQEVQSTRTTPADLLAEVARSRPIAVTELAAFEADPRAVAQDLIRPVPAPPGTATQVGTAFHAWMEARLRRLSVSGADQDLTDEEEKIRRPLVPKDQDLLDGLIASAATLSLEDYEVVAVEVPFSVAERGRIIRGRIDAVLRERAGNSGERGDYLLLDWKTTRGGPHKLTDSQRTRYATQLRYYRRAWSEAAQAQGSYVKAALVFVSPTTWWVVTEQELQGQP